MEYFGKIIATTKEDMTRSDDGEAVMTQWMFSHVVSRRQVNILQRGCRSKKLLIEYSSLPERFRLRFEAKYGDPAEILKPKTMSLVINATAQQYYANDYRLPNGDQLPVEYQKEYTLNASVLDILLAQVNKQKADRNRLKSSTRIIWENIYAESERIRKEFGHTLPANTARLKDKLRLYVVEGFASLVSKKFCNANTLKITEAAGRQIIALRRSRVPVYTLDQLFDRYNEIAETKGWKPLRSVNALKNYLNRPEVLPKWYDAVHGELAAKQLLERKQKTGMPSMRDALWYGDGTKLNLYYKGRDKDGKLVKMTTQVYEVIDAFSELLLGYCISSSENFTAQRKAFRMAVETAGHRPYEIVTDNQGGATTNAAKLLMSNICRVARATAPHTPQAKSIEAIFGRIQGKVLHRDWRFTGANITAKGAEARPNIEFVEDNVEGLYTYEEMCAAYAQYREVWNEMPHPRTKKSRREMYRESVNAQAPEVTAIDMMEMFWSETAEPSTYTGSGITFQVDKQKYTYEVVGADGLPDMAFRAENTLRKFYVRYDPDDMSMVRLCIKNATGTRIVADARPYLVVPRAIQEQTAKDQEFLRTTIEQNKQARIRRAMENYQLEVEHGVAPEQHGLQSPKMRGISRRDLEKYTDRYVASVVPIVPEQSADPNPMACEPIAVGQVEKQLSNLTFDQIQAINKW